MRAPLLLVVMVALAGAITARESHQIDRDCASTCTKAANRVRCINTCRESLRKRLERGIPLQQQQAAKGPARAKLTPAKLLGTTTARRKGVIVTPRPKPRAAVRRNAVPPPPHPRMRGRKRAHRK